MQDESTTPAELATRTQAVLWGVKHGFTPDHNRIEHWKGGP
jgi:hypothetical protein